MSTDEPYENIPHHKFHNDNQSILVATYVKDIMLVSHIVNRAKKTSSFPRRNATLPPQRYDTNAQAVSLRPRARLARKIPSVFYAKRFSYSITQCEITQIFRKSKFS